MIGLSRVNHMAPAKQIVARKRKYFTVGEANKALPLVKRIVSDIVHQYRVVEDLQQRLAMVSRDRRRPSNDLYSEELAQSQAEFEAEESKLSTYVEELRAWASSSRARTACAISAASWMAGKCISAGVLASRR